MNPALMIPSEISCSRLLNLFNNEYYITLGWTNCRTLKIPDPLNTFQTFASEFANERINAQDREIPNPMQRVTGWGDDIVVEDDDGGENGYRVDEGNRELG